MNRMVRDRVKSKQGRVMKNEIKLAWFIMVIWCVFFSSNLFSRNVYAKAGDYNASTEEIDGPLSLEKCIRIAIKNNPDIGTGKEAVAAARAERDEATGQRWPTLNAVGGYTHTLDDQRLMPVRRPAEPGVYADDTIRGDLIARIPLFTGGRITNEIMASEFLNQSAEKSLIRTRRRLIFEVSRVFYSILGQHRVIESVAFSKKTLAEHRRRVEDLIRAQRAAKVDLLRTNVKLANVKQDLVREENLLAIQRRFLANLLGLGNGASGLSVQGKLNLQPVNPNLDLNLKKANQSRTDFKALKAELEAQKRKVAAARAGHWPTVWLQGSYGGRWAVGSSLQQPGADTMEDEGQVGLLLDIPLFEGGRVSARVRKEEAKARSAGERLRKLELQIRLDVETAILDITSDLERIQATKEAVEQGKESFRIEQEKYALGKGSITDVLDAQSSLLEAQTNYYRAMAGYNTAIAQLRLSTGEE